MRILRWIVVSCFALTFTAAFARPEPNAFLNKRADTIAQLLDQIRSDKQVADRYERHYGMSKQELLNYFGHLHSARLAEDGTYFIYLVDDQGIIKAHSQRLRAATRVFADANGVPILKATCGNAMTNGSDMQNTAMNPEMPEMPDTTTLTRGVAVTIPESAEVFQPMAALTPSDPIALQPATPQVTTGSRNQGIAILPAILGALGGGGALLLGGGGGGGGGAPVPEPTGLVVLAAAIGGLLLRRLR